MSDKPRVLHINAHHCECTSDSENGGFVLSFHGRTEGGNVHIVRVQMGSLWWVKYLIRDIKSMLSKKRQALEEAEKCIGEPG